MSWFGPLFRALLLTLLLASALTIAAEAAEVTFALTITNGHVPDNMRLIRVKQNDVVKLQWSADKAMQIHLHGYDIEKDLKPGTITEMVLTARATGRFTVAPHTGEAPGGGHTHGDVLVTIEVYP
jgi:hypothetical protein